MPDYQDVKPKDIIIVDWLGGTYLAEQIAGFNIYMGAAPDEPVGATPVAYVPAYPNGFITDGFGEGGFGDGGFGRSATEYQWNSAELASGTWHMAITVVDIAGEEGNAKFFTMTTTARPQPPAVDRDGLRLHYSYNPTTHVVTLTWLAAPAS